MVKVECEGCQSPYQIDERRIPPTGLKMRCPKCGKSVLVQRPGAAGAAPAPASPAPAPPPQAPPAQAPAPQAQPATPMPRPAAPPVGAGLRPPPAAAPAAAPPRPPPRPAPPAGGGGRGFGELDLMVELPNPEGDDAPGSGGGVDLPAVGRQPASPFGPSFGGGGGQPAPAPPEESFSFGGGGGGFGEIDLPAPAQDRAPAGPFGAVDLPAFSGAPAGAPFGAGSSSPHGGGSSAGFSAGPSSSGGGSGVDLPAPVGRPSGPFGAVDLPVVEGEGAFGSVDLPAAVARPARNDFAFPPAARPPGVPSHAGLPAVGAGLPMAAGAQLPMVAGAQLPSASQAGLPAYGQQPGLPVPAGHGGGHLPSLSSAGLPAVGGNYPAVSSGGSLPMPVVGGGLPVAAGGSALPSPATAGFPMHASAGFPSAAGAGFPTAAEGSALPSPMGQGALPSAAGAAGFPMNAFGGGSLPTPATSGGLPATPSPGDYGGGYDPGFPHAPGAGGEIDGFGGDDYGRGGGAGSGFDPSGGGYGEAPRPADNAGEYDPMAGAALFGGPSGGSGAPPLAGGELDLEAGTMAHPGAELAPAPIPVARPGARDSLEPVRKKSKAPKIVGAVVAVLVVGGASLGLSPKLGVFGLSAIMDSVNATSHAEALAALRKSAQGKLEGDTISGATKAVSEARLAASAAPRHADTQAYAAYLMYQKSLRFGQDGPTEATGASMLDQLPADATSELIILARASRDAATGQLARAKQTLGGLAAKDVDAAVLLGEIELLARSEKIVEAWDRAVKLSKSPRTLGGLARAQFAAGKAKEAEATAKQVLEAAPKHVSARNLLARIALREEGRDVEAVSLLTKVVDDKEVRVEAGEGELVEAYTLMGLAHLENSRMSLAEQSFAQALKLDQQSVEALVGNGELFYRQGRFSEAQARFEAATRADADTLVGRIGVAKTLIKLERAKDAKDLVKKLAEAHGKDPRVAHWLGKAEEALGNRKEAQTLYTEAIKLAGADPVAVDSYVALSGLLASFGRTDEAAKKLEEASKLFPNLPALYRARGDVALASGRYEKAKQEYELALAKRDDLSTRFQMGIALRRMRLFDEAAAVFDQVASKDKDFPGLAVERGLYYQETGQGEQALALYGEALAKAPNDVDLKLRVASTQVDAGHPEKADAALQDVLKERPNSAEANHYYGRVLLAKGQNLGEAMSYLQKAVRFDPNRAEYHLYLAIASNGAGQPGAAEASITRALELDSEMGEAYWQRGVMKQKLGATLDAITDLQKALDKRPSLHQAYATLALCYEDQSSWAYAETSWKSALKGNPRVAEWHYKLGALYAKHIPNDVLLIEHMTKAIELAADQNPRPTWLFQAHHALAEAYDGKGDKDKARTHFKAFLEMAPANHAYRTDAEAALQRLGG